MNSVLLSEEKPKYIEKFERIAGAFSLNYNGPTVVLIGGIHGNESSGCILSVTLKEK
jgi:predicted deacylase